MKRNATPITRATTIAYVTEADVCEMLAIGRKKLGELRDATPPDMVRPWRNIGKRGRAARYRWNPELIETWFEGVTAWRASQSETESSGSAGKSATATGAGGTDPRRSPGPAPASGKRKGGSKKSSKSSASSDEFDPAKFALRLVSKERTES